MFFVERDRSHVNVMVADQVENGSTRTGKKPGSTALPQPSNQPLSNHAQAGLAPTIGTAAPDNEHLSPPISRPAVPAGAIEFSLERSSRPQTLGPVKLKLVRTDSSGLAYDVNVVIGARSHLHRQVKLNEPLWIVVNRGAASVKIVVDSIGQDRVSGYWNESGRPARIRRRKRA